MTPGNLSFRSTLAVSNGFLLSNYLNWIMKKVPQMFSSKSNGYMEGIRNSITLFLEVSHWSEM